MDYKVISADSHVSEPPHLWKKWLAPEFQKYAPKLVKDPDGGDAWQYGEGIAPAMSGLILVKRGRKYADKDYRWSGLTFEAANATRSSPPAVLRSSGVSSLVRKRFPMRARSTAVPLRWGDVTTSDASQQLTSRTT